MRRCAPLLFLSTLSLLSPSSARAEFLDDFPHLKKMNFAEPPSPVRLGFGITPVGIMKDKTYLGLSLFQAHWISKWVDWEIGGVSVGVSNARNPYADSRSFMARTVPKIRALDNLSIGAIWGYELISFPNTTSRVFKEFPNSSGLKSPPEPFSSSGMMYGALLSLLIPTDSGTVRVSPLYLVRTYPHKNIKDGWKYIFENKELESSTAQEELAAESLVAIELGFML